MGFNPSHMPCEAFPLTLLFVPHVLSHALCSSVPTTPSFTSAPCMALLCNQVGITYVDGVIAHIVRAWMLTRSYDSAKTTQGHGAQRLLHMMCKPEKWQCHLLTGVSGVGGADVYLHEPLISEFLLSDRN